MKIEHIAIYVTDIDKSRDFFIKYFNAKSNELYHNETKKFSSYFLTFDDGARIELMNIPNLLNKDLNAVYTGFSHIAFSVGSKEKVLSLTEILRNDGYEVTGEPRTTGDGYFESVISFEGNLIEITV